jgi:hypothetical protein
MKLPRIIYLIIALAIVVFSCKDKKPENNPPIDEEQPTAEEVIGFNVLDKIKGIWDGPVTSTTALGSYPKWVVDFRPISASHISAKNELDILNDIHMAFFVTKYNGKNYVAFRNGGMFNGNTRTSYFLTDSVSETSSHSFYRFSEIIKGRSRAYTEVIFKGDSVTINSYTNVYDTEATAVPHMTWKAKRKDLTACANAVSNFNFPQKVIAKDFSNAFEGAEEAIFYNAGAGDPYTEDIYPYLGQSTVNYSYQGVTPNASNKTFLLVLTQPLFSPTGYNPSSMNHISRYVTLASNDLDYVFNYMHPGSYYVYAIYDANGDGVFGSGDYINYNAGTLSLSSESTASSSVVVNFQIP